MKYLSLHVNISEEIKAVIDSKNGFNESEKLTNLIIQYNKLKKHHSSCKDQRKILQNQVNKLASMAFYDPNTNLPNKHYLELKLEKLISKIHSAGDFFSVVIIDISTTLSKLPTEDYRFLNKKLADNIGEHIRKTDIVTTLDVSLLAIITYIKDLNILKAYVSRVCRILEKTIDDIYETDINILKTISYGYTIASPEDSISTLLDRVIDETQKNKASDL